MSPQSWLNLNAVPDVRALVVRSYLKKKKTIQCDYHSESCLVPLPRVSYRRSLPSKNKLFAIFRGDIMFQQRVTIRNQANTGEFSRNAQKAERNRQRETGRA